MAVDIRPGAALLLAAAMLGAGPVRAAALGDAQIRSFVGQQQRSWNAGDLDAYFAGFRPDARFTDQYRTPSGQVVPYGTSTLAQARIQSRKFRATSKVAERGEILRIAVSADGRSAEVVSQVTSQIQGPKGARTTCAERRQELVLEGAAVRSRGQTDTFSRCPRPRARP
jgi:hypothetical protein